MKLAISNIAWDKSQDQKMYSLLRDLQIDGLEIAPTRLWPEQPYKQRKAAYEYAQCLQREYGLSICSMQSIWYGKEQELFGSLKEEKVLYDYTCEAILFAESIGCGNLVFGCPRNRQIRLEKDGTYNSDDYARAISFFREIGDFAFEHHTCFSIEANPLIYHTNFINETNEAVGLAKTVDSRGFKVNGDFGTIIENGEELSDIEENVDLFRHFHISEPGLEIINPRSEHQELFDILKRKDYKNYVSIEMKKCADVAEVEAILKYIKSININNIN